MPCPVTSVAGAILPRQILRVLEVDSEMGVRSLLRNALDHHKDLPGDARDSRGREPDLGARVGRAVPGLPDRDDLPPIHDLCHLVVRDQEHRCVTFLSSEVTARQ